MRRIFRRILSFLISLLIVSPNGVSIRSVTINGRQYRNGFYPDYMYVSSAKEEHGIQVGTSIYYPVQHDHYEIYQNGDFSNKIGGELYCLEEQWDDAHSFYSSAENYRFVLYTKNNPSPLYDVELSESNTIKPEWDMFDQLLQRAYAINQMNWFNEYVEKSTTLEMPESSVKGSIFYELVAYSVDDQLKSLAVTLFIHNGALHYFVGINGNYDFITGIDKEDIYYFTPVDGETSNYFSDIIDVIRREA